CTTRGSSAGRSRAIAFAAASADGEDEAVQSRIITIRLGVRAEAYARIAKDGVRTGVVPGRFRDIAPGGLLRRWVIGCIPVCRRIKEVIEIRSANCNVIRRRSDAIYLQTILRWLRRQPLVE